MTLGSTALGFPLSPTLLTPPLYRGGWRKEGDEERELLGTSGQPAISREINGAVSRMMGLSGDYFSLE